MNQAQILWIDPINPEPDKLARAAALLRAGKLVAFPTETVYGLGANAFDAAAVERVFAAKQRPANDPLIVHIAAETQLPAIAAEVTAEAHTLARVFWPGPLTLILRKTAAIPLNVTAGLDTVAVRMPANEIALALIRACGFPIAAPSANLFARPSPTTAAHVLEDLGGRIDLVIDGGPTLIGVESTVVDMTSQPPRVLRPGGTSVEALQAVLPAVHIAQPKANTTKSQPSPGLLDKHYSPRARVELFEGQGNAVLEHIRRRAIELVAENAQVGLLIAKEDHSLFQDLPVHIELLGSKNDLAKIARTLFAAMRRLDSANVNVILATSFGAAGIGLAIQDRLTRAAGGQVERIET
jgi:L-threonylcarbamoyladenylate synthase